MKIGGIIDISTKDVPNKVSTVIFTFGCNFACPFCHNKHLLAKNGGKEQNLDHLIKIVNQNRLINWVSISGGEPTLQADLEDLCKRLKESGKFVSLDTNGSKPEIIKKLLPYLDRVAMDVKTPFSSNRIEEIIGKQININSIVESFTILNEHPQIDFEIRTTFVKKLLKSKEVREIIRFLIKKRFRGNYVLQQYQFSEHIDSRYKNKFEQPSHELLLKIIEPYTMMDLSFNIFVRDEVDGYFNCRTLLKASPQI
ncbi:MAG: anaerobic ribonucleoside-triphosphate reductase activating protein [Candidatus Lokiarchaeota archaeon]|nr:anaerobic ribonucleoside-triphosphate reductase activating protein [Candidatus Lokiarchaeota archaeon]MBD3340026.1 anaerobic ribonucleoside-triphosphate reductase activating protein [Candidatus Lokiarchaeota archaeon]